MNFRVGEIYTFTCDYNSMEYTITKIGDRYMSFVWDNGECSTDTYSTDMFKRTLKRNGAKLVGKVMTPHKNIKKLTL